MLHIKRAQLGLVSLLSFTSSCTLVMGCQVSTNFIINSFLDNIAEISDQIFVILQFQVFTEIRITSTSHDVGLGVPPPQASCKGPQTSRELVVIRGHS